MRKRILAIFLAGASIGAATFTVAQSTAVSSPKNNFEKTNQSTISTSMEKREGHVYLDVFVNGIDSRSTFTVTKEMEMDIYTVNVRNGNALSGSGNDVFIDLGLPSGLDSLTSFYSKGIETQVHQFPTPLKLREGDEITFGPIGDASVDSLVVLGLRGTEPASDKMVIK